jgi:hypothetical protein
MGAKPLPARASKCRANPPGRNLKPPEAMSVLAHVELMEQSMKPVSYCCLVAGLVVAIAPIMASSGYAKPLPTIENSAPGISRPAPARPTQSLDPSMPNLGSPNSTNPMDQLGPPTEARQETLADCMSFWDAGTHMSKSEWRLTCQRTQNGQYF